MVGFSSDGESTLEKYRQKMEIFRILRNFRMSLAAAGLARSLAPKCTVLEVENLWISIFGTTSLSCDMLQFIHAIDTCKGWPEGGCTLKDKALIFKLIAAKSGEASFQTMLESPLCFVPFIAPQQAPKAMICENVDFADAVHDIARSVTYRKVDLFRLDLFASGYVSAEELQIVTPRIYKLQIIKAAVVQILTGYCEENNLVLTNMTIDYSSDQYARVNSRKVAARTLPSDGPWNLRHLLEACEIWDRNVVFKAYLNDPEFQKIYKQISEPRDTSKVFRAEADAALEQQIALRAEQRKLQAREQQRAAEMNKMITGELSAIKQQKAQLDMPVTKVPSNNVPSNNMMGQNKNDMGSENNMMGETGIGKTVSNNNNMGGMQMEGQNMYGGFNASMMQNPDMARESAAQMALAAERRDRGSAAKQEPVMEEAAQNFATIQPDLALRKLSGASTGSGGPGSVVASARRTTQSAPTTAAPVAVLPDVRAPVAVFPGAVDGEPIADAPAIDSLKILVQRGLGMVDPNGTSIDDSYVEIRMGIKAHKTPMVSANNGNPIWNYQTSLPYQKEQEIRFVVWDKDDFSKNEHVGEGGVPLFEGMSGNKTIPLTLQNGKPAGMLSIGLAWGDDALVIEEIVDPADANPVDAGAGATGPEGNASPAPAKTAGATRVTTPVAAPVSEVKVAPDANSAPAKALAVTAGALEEEAFEEEEFGEEEVVEGEHNALHREGGHRHVAQGYRNAPSGYGNAARGYTAPYGIQQQPQYGKVPLKRGNAPGGNASGSSGLQRNPRDPRPGGRSLMQSESGSRSDIGPSFKSGVSTYTSVRAHKSGSSVGPISSQNLNSLLPSPSSQFLSGSGRQSQQSGRFSSPPQSSEFSKSSRKSSPSSSESPKRSSIFGSNAKAGSSLFGSNANSASSITGQPRYGKLVNAHVTHTHKARETVTQEQRDRIVKVVSRKSFSVKQQMGQGNR